MKLRSKTEECWAAIFNGIGLHYEYEPHCAETRHGKYWPDFYFPEVGRYFEVKGPEANQLELEKAFDFRAKKKEAVYFLTSMPTKWLNRFGLWYLDKKFPRAELLMPCRECLFLFLGFEKEQIPGALAKARIAATDFHNSPAMTLDDSITQGLEQLAKWHPKTFTAKQGEITEGAIQ